MGTKEAASSEGRSSEASERGREENPPRQVLDTWGTNNPTQPAPPMPSDAPGSWADFSSKPRHELDTTEVEGFSKRHPRVRYTLDAVEIRGNTKTRSRVVLRYLPFSPGDLLDVDDPKLISARYRLLLTGFFRDVQFSLRKGTEPGHVVLVIGVTERNTIVVTQLWMGLGADADSGGNARPLTAYGGMGLAETNLAGTGITLGTALGLADHQLAWRVNFLDPAFMGSAFKLDAEFLFNDAEDYFGNSGVRHFGAGTSVFRDFAVVDYTRFGGRVGLGLDTSLTTQLWVHYRLESVEARVPQAAEHDRSGYQAREPIDFSVNPGKSLLSTVSATFRYDTRDQPFLPRRGWLAQATGEIGLAPLGSDYDFQRFEVRAAHWFTLPWKHIVEVRAIAGAIAGYSPFFEQYYINDFSELRSPRVLGLNFDRRPPPNFLNTSISEVRRGQYAAEVGAEYRIPLYVGHRSVYGIDLFSRVGLYGLVAQSDLTDPPKGWSGLGRIPLDLTFNLGFKLDTAAGAFSFAFSNVLGFVPVH